MKKTGVAYLPLHGGRAPRWLITRMERITYGIVTVLVEEYGCREFLQRISNPYWFQALSCCIGYDWHSSGTTTVATAILKNMLDPEKHGIAVCGGKGKTSRKTPIEILDIGDTFNFSTKKIQNLIYASRMCAKVDNSAIQSGYPLYHHAFFFNEDGEWAVIQQGMNVEDKIARRYHWHSNHVKSFVEEPHNAILCDSKREIALNMIDKSSEGCRKTSTDIAKERPIKVLKMLKSLRPLYQRSLKEWIPEIIKEEDYAADTLYLPRHINWKAIKKAYEIQPKNYEEILAINGVGPSTVRGLALISELIYGEKPSWKDPVKFSFAFGGKDGVPFPIDRNSMDKAINILERGIEEANVGKNEKLKALKRLRSCVPPTIS